MEQLSFVNMVPPGAQGPFEVEKIPGQVAPAFPVILAPTTNGCAVQVPADVEYRVFKDEDGTTTVMLRFKR